MNIKKILLTGGRSPSTLHLARLLNKNKITVYLAESLQYNITKYSNTITKAFHVNNPVKNEEDYINDLIKIIKNENIEMLIPTCEEIFYIAKNKDKLSKYCKVFTDNIDKLLLLHNKWEFIKLLQKYNIITPVTYYVTSLQDINNILHKNNKKFILKPIYSRFSSKVIIINENQEVLDKNIHISNEFPWILQEFIEGQQYCSFSISIEGNLKIYSDYKTEYSAGIGATIAFKYEDNQQIFEWVKQLTNLLKFNGQIAFDFIIDKNKNVYAIECNPRLTSGIHLFNQQNIFKSFYSDEGVIYPNKNKQYMITLAMLSYGFFKKREINYYLHWIKTFFKSKDIIFSFKDIKPSIYQFFIMYYLWKIAKKNNLTLIEASTADIEWNG